MNQWNVCAMCCTEGLSALAQSETKQKNHKFRISWAEWMHLSCKHLLPEVHAKKGHTSEGLSFLHEKVLQLAAYLLPPYGRFGFFFAAFSLPHCTRRVFRFNYKKFFFLFNFRMRRKLLQTWLLTSLWCDCCFAFRFSCKQQLFNQNSQSHKVYRGFSCGWTFSSR